MVDICLSFEEDARVEEVADLQTQMHEELNSQLGNCVVNIIMKNGRVSKGGKHELVFVNDGLHYFVEHHRYTV